MPGLIEHTGFKTRKRIAVIGAGISGLSSIKSCLEEGLNPVCFEQRSNLGGLWNYADKVEKGRSSVMKTTVSNQCKETYCFSDFPVPDHFPVFFTQPRMFEYLKMYAERFDLERYVQYNTEVVRVEQAEDFPSTGRWWVTTKHEQTGKESRELFDGVMICSGHHWDPFTPSYTGQEEFKGLQLHSSEYRTHTGFEGKRVVVVGIGNSAVDIACELDRVCDQVYLSTRKGAWVFPRLFYNGIPFALCMNRRVLLFIRSLIPATLRNYIWVCIMDLLFSHEKYGLEPKHPFESQNPTCSDELPNALISGRVKLKCGVESLTEDSVKFDDGTTEEKIDAVIYGTGFNLNFGFMKHEAFKVKDHQTELYKFVFPPEIQPPTIAAIGFVEAFGPILASCEIHGRWAARVFSGNLKLPSSDKMWHEIRSRNENIYKMFQHTMRHGIHYDWITQMDDVAEELGCKPDIKSYILKDPRLAWSLYFNPTVPCHYRLAGPGAWSGARDNALGVWDRLVCPSRTRKIEKGDWRTAGAVLKSAILFIVFIWFFVL